MWLLITIAFVCVLLFFAHELSMSIELVPHLEINKDGLVEIEGERFELDETLLVRDTDKIHFSKTN
jgi:hypothetical protein